MYNFNSTCTVLTATYMYSPSPLISLSLAISLKNRSSSLSVASQSGQQDSEQQSRSELLLYLSLPYGSSSFIYTTCISIIFSLLVYRSSQGIVRDLRTGKGIVEFFVEMHLNNSQNHIVLFVHTRLFLC